jgi:hypothetical protein
LGDAGVFATIEWGGIQIKSRTVRSPLINKSFHFHIPIPPNVKKDPELLVDFFNEDLQTKPRVVFNVWIDYGMCVENIGCYKAPLYKLYSCKLDD